MTVAICRGITRAGKPCRARPLAGSTWCVNHSPDITDAQRAEWRARGGTQSSNRARARKQLPGEAMEADELNAWLGVLFRRLARGEIEPAVATAAASLGRSIVEIGKAAEIEERVVELERELGIERRRKAS